MESLILTEDEKRLASIILTAPDTLTDLPEDDLKILMILSRKITISNSEIKKKYKQLQSNILVNIGRPHFDDLWDVTIWKN